MYLPRQIPGTAYDICKFSRKRNDLSDTGLRVYSINIWWKLFLTGYHTWAIVLLFQKLQEASMNFILFVYSVSPSVFRWTKKEIKVVNSLQHYKTNRID